MVSMGFLFRMGFVVLILDLYRSVKSEWGRGRVVAVLSSVGLWLVAVDTAPSTGEQEEDSSPSGSCSNHLSQRGKTHTHTWTYTHALTHKLTYVRTHTHTLSRR